MSIWKYALVCAVTAILLYFAGTKLPASFGLTNPDMPVLIVIMNTLLAFGLYAFLSRPTEPAVFMNLFLMTLVVKMLFAVGFMVVLAFLSPDHLEGNVVFSFICYLLFTFLETVILFRAKKQA